MRRKNESREHAEHLHDIGDGIGCTEIWEHLSDQRAEESGNEEDERR